MFGSTPDCLRSPHHQLRAPLRKIWPRIVRTNTSIFICYCAADWKIRSAAGAATSIASVQRTRLHLLFLSHPPEEREMRSRYLNLFSSVCTVWCIGLVDTILQPSPVWSLSINGNIRLSRQQYTDFYCEFLSLQLGGLLHYLSSGPAVLVNAFHRQQNQERGLETASKIF